MERKYVAFISYRHAELDSAVAKKLHALIEQYVIPKGVRKAERKFGNVFRDEEELPASNNLSDEICRALDNAQYLIVVCSENTRQSPWVNREIEYFLSHHDRQRVFTVLASGEPGEVFPEPLTRIVNDDGTVTEVEPLAVDVRADSIPAMGKKLSKEIFRLYAAMLGCPYDALVQREQRRKRKRTAALLSLSFAVVMTFTTMVLLKNRQIDQKNEQLEGMNQTLEDKNLELEEKNEELARQKAEVQQRESELLTEDALEALAEGDTLTALEKAVAALPKEGDDRPYYALAEQALFSSLDLFGSSGETFRITQTVLQQTTPVADFCISQDGAHLAAIDAYNVVSGFDAQSGNLVWTHRLSTDSSVDNMALHMSDTGDLIAVSADQIAALDFATGRVLWSHGMGNTTPCFLTEDGSVLAYLEMTLSENGSDFLYGYTFLSTQTGEVLTSVPIVEGAFVAKESGLPEIYFMEQLNRTVNNNVFSADGTRFAGCYYEEDTEGNYTLCCYVVDWHSGTMQQVYSEALGTGYTTVLVQELFFSQDETALVAVRKYPESHVMAQVDKIDLQTGKRLWRAVAPERENAYYASGDPFFCLREGAYLLVARKTAVELLDLSNGEFFSYVTLGSDIVGLTKEAGGMHTLVQSNGRYVVGWITEEGLNYSHHYFYSVSFELGQAVAAKSWNGGFQRVDPQTINLSIGDLTEGYGYVAVVPAEAPNNVIIWQVTFFDDPVTRHVIDGWQSSYRFSDAAGWRYGENALVLGPIRDWDAEAADHYMVIEGQTHAVIRTVPLSESLHNARALLLPDDTGYIVAAEEGNITHYDNDGNVVRVLSENESITVLENELLTLSESKYLHGAAVRSSDGSVVSVKCAEEGLTVWINGEDEKNVPYPAGVTAVKWTDSGCARFLAVESGGYVAVSNFEDGDTVIDSFALYDTLNDRWHLLEDAQLHIESGALCLGQETPKVAIVDESDTVYIYHIPTGTLESSFSLQLPSNSIANLSFLLEDSCLMVKTQDQQILFYDIATGQILYSEKLPTGAYGNIYLYADTVNQRLYVVDDDNANDSGLCLELSSWTKLADIPGLLYYDAARNEVYCYHYGVGIVAHNVPNTAQLVQIGQNMLDML